MSLKSSNHKLRIATIVGARPQFIKSAAVTKVVNASQDVEEFLIHTGQHYDQAMSDIFFTELGLRAPDKSLSIGAGSPVQQIGTMISRLEPALTELKPDVVLVYGDTNSTLAGAIAASKLGLKIAHVEAGLRHGNRTRSEEVNRIITDHTSDFLFTPHQRALDSLLKEGLSDRVCLAVGDVMYDVALSVEEKAKKNIAFLDTVGVRANEFGLCSIHRAENTDDPARLEVLSKFLVDLSKDIPIVLPIHPRTRKALEQHGIDMKSSGLKIIEPVGYLDMILLETTSKIILTDSGGVQREAYFFSKPCITLRDETEWTELVESGWNVVCPLNDHQMILDAAYKSLQLNTQKLLKPAFFGDGKSAEKIVACLRENILCAG